MGFSRQEYWSGLAFPSPVDHILSDLSTMTHLSWVAPHGVAWFHWVRQGCGPCDQIDWFSVIMISVCLPSDALWQYLVYYLCFSYLDVGYLFLAAPAKSAAAPYLGWGVSPHSCPSWPWTWSSSSLPSFTCAATAPWTWGCSSRPQPLTSDVG